MESHPKIAKCAIFRMGHPRLVEFDREGLEGSSRGIPRFENRETAHRPSFKLAHTEGRGLALSAVESLHRLSFMVLKGKLRAVWSTQGSRLHVFEG